MKELQGKISVKINEGPFNELLKKHVTAYDPARFEIIAVRFFYARELVFTVFARDLLNNGSNVSEGRIPVKKFKIQITSYSDLLGISDAFNFTIYSEDHTPDEMEVINK